MDPTEDPDVLLDFFSRFHSDLAEGGARELSHYLPEQGDAQSAVAREYLRACATAPTDDGTPDLEARYRDLRLVARSGQADVYRGVDAVLGSPVAIKMLRRGTWSERGAERAREEARLVSSLDHPGICRVLDVRVVEGAPWIVLGWVEGRTLASAIREAAESGESLDSRSHLRRTVTMVEGLARAVQFAHSRSVVHGDIKPGNVMLSGAEEGEPRPVLLDFGCARLVPAGTKTALRFGTPGYSSPEQVAGRGADHRSDVFSLGVVLYECLTGTRPFQRATDEETFAAVLDEEPADPRRIMPGVPADLVAVLRAALCKDPARRYASAGAFAADLRAVLEHRPVAVRPLPFWSRAALWVRRNPWPAALIAALAIGLAGVFWQFTRAERAARQAERDASTARQERGIADAARTAARRSAAAAAHAAGVLATRMGRWDDALALLQDARSLGYDEVETTLGMVHALEGALRVDEASQLLAGLAAGEHGHAAQVLLLDADLVVDRLENPDHKLEQVARALETDELDPADAAYARCLLATTVTEARAHLEAALWVDPYHRRAIETYAVLLVASGDIGAADRFITDTLARFPGSPAVESFAMFVAELRGEPERSAALLARALDGARAQERRIIELIRDGARLIRGVSASLAAAPDASPDFLPLFAFAARTTAILRESRGLRTFRICPALARRYLAVIGAVGARGSLHDRLEAVAGALETAAEDLGDPFLLHFAGTVRMILEQPDRAEPLFLAAASRPGGLIAAHVSRFAALDAQVAQRMALADRSPDAARAIAGRAARNADALALDPRLPPDFVGPACVFARRLDLWDAAELLDVRWRRAAPADPFADIIFAELLLREDLGAAADSVVARVLARDPDHELAIRLRDRLTERR